MAKKYRIEKVVEEVRHLESVTCDRCGVTIPKTSYFHQRNFTLKFLEGDVFPEGGSLEGWEVEDVCDDCLDFLKDLLIQNGFTIKSIET